MIFLGDAGMLVRQNDVNGGREMRTLAFQSTHWSLLEELRASDPARRKMALECLCANYWKAVRGYLERRGVRAEQAEEITQAFFADAVIGRAIFERADPTRGRLRSLVLTALKRYRIDLARREASRGGVARDIHFSDKNAIESAANPEATEGDSAFDRDWASLVVSEAVRRCESHFIDTKKQGHWRAFELRVLHPTSRMVLPIPLEKVAAQCGFPGPADVAAAVGYVKRRLDLHVREVVSETAAPESADEEYNYLKAHLG